MFLTFLILKTGLLPKCGWGFIQVIRVQRVKLIRGQHPSCRACRGAPAAASVHRDRPAFCHGGDGPPRRYNSSSLCRWSFCGHTQCFSSAGPWASTNLHWHLTHTWWSFTNCSGLRHFPEYLRFWSRTGFTGCCHWAHSTRLTDLTAPRANGNRYIPRRSCRKSTTSHHPYDIPRILPGCHPTLPSTHQQINTSTILHSHTPANPHRNRHDWGSYLFLLPVHDPWAWTTSRR